MKITDISDSRENWHEVLSLWNRVSNWSHYNTSERELKQQIKSLVIFMWNEKDWLKKEYPENSRDIEQFINDSNFIKIVADLANGLKHRGVDRASRSDSKETEYYGRITFGSGRSRQMIYIQQSDNSVVELFQVLRGALDEYDKLHTSLYDS